MTYPVYTVYSGDVLPIFFSTYDGGTGASITLTGLAVTDVEIYRDGSTTQRASDAGYTLLDTDGIDFDGLTGIHGFSIDTGDNTDAGFYTVGSWYHVVVSSVTVDAQTVNFIAAAFRIVAAETAAGYPKVDVAYISGDSTAADNAELAFDGTGYGFTGCTMPTTTTATNVTTVNGLAANVITAASINADAITAAKIADGAIDAATFAAGAITSAVIATGAIDADALAADAGSEIADAVWDEAFAGHVAAGSFGKITQDIEEDTQTMIPNTLATLATGAAVADVPTVAEFEARTLVAANYFDPAADTVANVTTVASVTNPVTLANGAHGGAAATMQLGGAGGLTSNITGNLSGSVGSVTGAVGSVTGAVGSVGAGGITAASFGAGAITAAVIATDAIDADAIAANAIDSGAIADGAITAAKIATDAIDNDAVAANAVTEIQAGLATAASIAALNDISVADIISGIADGAYDLQEMIRIMFAALAGKAAGGGTPNLSFRDSADTKNRIAATVDANGNRTAMVLDGS